MKQKKTTTLSAKGGNDKPLNRAKKKAKSKTPKVLDLTAVDEIIDRYHEKKGALIPVLQEVQGHYGYIPEGVVPRISEGLKVYQSSIYGVLTFYTQFNLKPMGRNIVRVCCGTACHVRGAERVSSKFKEVLKVPVGETTEDRNFTLEQVACIGACSLAPAVMVNDEVHGKVTPDEAVTILDQYKG